MKTLVLTLEIEEDPVAFEIGMGMRLSLQSEVGQQAAVNAILAAAETIQRQQMIQDDESADPTGDPEARIVHAGLAARLALVDAIMHLPSMPVQGFVVDL